MERGNNLQRSVLTPYILIAPATIYIIAIMAFPLAFSFVRSFYDRLGDFIALDNYVELFTNPGIRQAIIQAFLFVVICAVGEMLLGIAYALLLNRKFPLRGFVRTLFLLPLLFPPVVAALNWGFLLHADYGFINQFLRFVVGVQSPPLWLARPNLAFLSVCIVTIWRNTPFVMILILGGLQSIDPDLYESAKIDGASRPASFFFITLPMLRYVILITIMLRVIDLFRKFDVIYVLTRGGPGGATEILSTRIYKLAFWEAQPGMAASLSYIALITTVALLVPFLILNRRRDV